MRIFEIEKLFESTETLNQVLEKCQEDFEKIDYWGNLLRSGVVDNPAEIKRALTELAGAYSNLRVILGIAEYKKKNKQVRFKEQIRIDTENEGKKYIDTKAETQASAHVAEYRRVRNIIGAYKESADKSIGVLQNVNNNLDKELNRNPSSKENQ